MSSHAAAIGHIAVTDLSVGALSRLGTWALEQHVTTFSAELAPEQLATLREAWKLARARESRQAARRAPPLAPEVLASALQDRIHPTSGRLLSAKPIARASRCPDCGGQNGEHPDLACAFA